MSHLRSLITVVSLAALFPLAGCSDGPSRLVPPGISASGAADQAMELYDADADGVLSSVELEKSPGLKAALETLDTDSDGQVSESEIADRIRSWQASRAALCSFSCQLTLNGKPLTGATVSFEPESFLGDEIQTAVGVTNRYGGMSPSIPKENRPVSDMPPGIQLGLFRVRVSKKVNGKETIPAKYNSETILGQQVANDDPAIMRHRISFALKK